ncbi:GNAT family N-acetyltransferase [Clostridioides difficile]
MIHNYVSVFKRVKLKPLELEDIEKLRILRNKNREYFIYSDEISGLNQIKWFYKYKTKEFDYMFKIEEINNPNKFIGAVAIYNVEMKNCTGEFGRLIIDSHATNSKGLGYEATICACKIGFDELKLNKINLEVFSDNIKALKTYIKAGFKEIKREKLNNREIIYMELLK